MHIGHVDVLNKVFIAGASALLADTAARLGAELGEGRTLDIAEM